MKQAQEQESKVVLFLALVLVLVKTERKGRSTNQITRSCFVRSLTTEIKMAEAEGRFEERFLEMVRQLPVIYDNGSYSLDTRNFRLRLFLCLLLRRQ